MLCPFRERTQKKRLKKKMRKNKLQQEAMVGFKDRRSQYSIK